MKRYRFLLGVALGAAAVGALWASSGGQRASGDAAPEVVAVSRTSDPSHPTAYARTADPSVLRGAPMTRGSVAPAARKLQIRQTPPQFNDPQDERRWYERQLIEVGELQMRLQSIHDRMLATSPKAPDDVVAEVQAELDEATDWHHELDVKLGSMLKPAEAASPAAK